MSLIAKVSLPSLWRSKVKKAKAPVEANGAKAPGLAPFKAGAAPPPSAQPEAKGVAKEESKQSEGAPKLKPWVKPGAQAPVAPTAVATAVAAPSVAAPKEPAPAAAASPAGAPPAPAAAPTAAPPADSSGLKDDLKSLFTEDDVGNEELRKLAEGLKELDINELARECRELAALLKGKVSQN